MVADPCALLVAMPEPEIVAAAAFEELHVAELVRFLVLWSLYVPVAVNCWPAPAATEGVPGVTAIETKVAGAAFDDELPPPHPTITAAHTTANRISNFFMNVFLVVTWTKNWTANSRQLSITGEPCHRASGESGCEE
jgi:hypothetical protein